MRTASKAILSVFSVILLIMFFVITACAHPGRTDSKGGHKDNENQSGLGGYHYHCGGYQAHLHSEDGCPYMNNADNQDTEKNSTEPTDDIVNDSLSKSVGNSQLIITVGSIFILSLTIIFFKAMSHHMTDF